MNLAACLTLTLHLASAHFGGGDYNERNLGAGLSCNGYHVGAYHNSLGRLSTYAGKSWTWCRRSACAGAALLFVTGYKVEPVIAPVPMVSFGGRWKLVLVGTPRMASSPGFLGVGIEIPIH